MNKEVREQRRREFIKWGWHETDSGFAIDADQFFRNQDQFREEVGPELNLGKDEEEFNFEELSQPEYHRDEVAYSSYPKVRRIGHYRKKA